jgi:hypothetical protein
MSMQKLDSTILLKIASLEKEIKSLSLLRKACVKDGSLTPLGEKLVTLCTKHGISTEDIIHILPERTYPLSNCIQTSDASLNKGLRFGDRVIVTLVGNKYAGIFCGYGEDFYIVRICLEEAIHEPAAFKECRLAESYEEWIKVLTG